MTTHGFREKLVCLISRLTCTYRAGWGIYRAIHYITMHSIQIHQPGVMYIQYAAYTQIMVVCLHVYIRKCSSWPKWPHSVHIPYLHALFIDISESFTIGHQSDAHEFYLALLNSIESRLDLKYVMTNTMYVYFMAVNCRGQDVMKSNLAMNLHSQSTSSS